MSTLLTSGELILDVGKGYKRRGAAAIEIDVNEVCEVAPLPKQVREKWRQEYENAKTSEKYPHNLEDLLARLDRAEKKRSVIFFK